MHQNVNVCTWAMKIQPDATPWMERQFKPSMKKKIWEFTCQVTVNQAFSAPRPQEKQCRASESSRGPSITLTRMDLLYCIEPTSDPILSIVCKHGALTCRKTSKAWRRFKGEQPNWYPAWERGVMRRDWRNSICTHWKWEEREGTSSKPSRSSMVLKI